MHNYPHLRNEWKTPNNAFPFEQNPRFFYPVKLQWAEQGIRVYTMFDSCMLDGSPYIVILSLDKGPCTLQLKLQRMSLSSIHTTTFFRYCNHFFNSFIYGQRFSQRFFDKGPCTLKLKLQRINVVIVHTHYNLFSQLQQLWYMCSDFHNDFPKIFVLCKGLKLMTKNKWGVGTYRVAQRDH